MDLDRNWREDDFGRAVWKFSKITGAYESLMIQIDGFKLQWKDEMEDEEVKVLIDKLLAEFSDFDDVMYDVMIPIYREMYTLDELNAIIDFFETPLGQKFAKNMPIMTMKTMEVNQKRGAEIVARLLAEAEL